ncbi:ABC transporter permease [Neorhizobium alkalisoli]|uniref:Peptide/nickel transport system permease protein n=1 Tax=Neorhizobium alkalisoli TaxID=528178 RepID=A0A561R901_9HYPH|nr:ABC transporter permease [Neorhizobium alkalisoli]TWF59081.1 peptide/nickel transport system permease protein [Neorhizobium alkalisoli]
MLFFVREPMATIGLILFSAIVLLAIFAPLISIEPEIDLGHRLMGPSLSAPLGTDRMGVDLLTSIIWGARSSLVIAIATVSICVAIGVPIGLVAGYYRHWFCESLMRVSDVALAVPEIMVAIAITQTLGPSISTVVIALSVTYWPFWARLVYAETKSMRNEIFIESAEALGVSPWRIMLLHILPGLTSSIVIRTSVGFGATILAASTLGCLGLGPPPPTPEWGRILSESRDYLPDAWWYPLAPGLAIFITVLGFYLFGDGLRKSLNPQLRLRSERW